LPSSPSVTWLSSVALHGSPSSWRS